VLAEERRQASVLTRGEREALARLLNKLAG
jgi:hypothetical protein